MKTGKRGRGLLTLAHGRQKYIDMAIQLARSIRLNSPNQTLAIVTDRSSEELRRWFDVVLPFKAEYGTGLVHKVFLYEYSPFRETLFIDADCLVVRDLQFLWVLFEGRDVSAIGCEMRSGSWSGIDVQATREVLGIPYVVQLNGGVYYFRRGDRSNQVFRTAQELIPRYQQLGIALLRGQMNDEPLMSLAMALHHQRPVDDRGRGMRTRVGQTGDFELDVLKNRCRFTKHGTVVEPAIMHFGGRHTGGFYYRRETRKMDLHEHGNLSRHAASAIVNLTWNPRIVLKAARRTLTQRITGLTSASAR